MLVACILSLVILQDDACARCGWAPPHSEATVTVRGVKELRGVVARAKPDTTILLEDGTYQLNGDQLDLSVQGLVLRSKKGRQARVVIRGRGMNERMVAVSVSAPRVTVADLTIGHVGFHGIQVRGERGASDVVIHNVHILDTGQQLIKGSTAPGGAPCRNGLVACSFLEYSDHAPGDYTNGVDVLNGAGWTVRDNSVQRIRGPRAQGWRTGPAILFWGGSRDTVVERNWLVDCYRGIALGLVQDQPSAPGPPRPPGRRRPTERRLQLERLGRRGDRGQCVARRARRAQHGPRRRKGPVVDRREISHCQRPGLE